MQRKAVAGPFDNQGNGKVRVEEDDKGRQWVTCTGCRLNDFSPGVSPARFQARKHAGVCGH